jgi:hypothetical protein
MAWTIYENLIKNKFKSVVFGYYKSFLNLFLSELLDNVDFSLYWDESNELIMAKNKHGRTVYQPVFQASGMETGFLGLALVYTFYIINMRNSVNIVFIDELSGTLNTGEDLDYPAENYQELFVLMLSKFKTVNRFIVDHNIKNLYETTTYLVSPNGIGAKVSIQ